jgi:hypothetical protein
MTAALQILAQRDESNPIQGFFDGLHTALRPDSVGPPAIMLVLGFVGGIVALLLIMAIVKSRRADAALTTSHGHPMKLFSQALRQLGINWRDRMLMRAVARRARLPHPTVLLLNPPLLQRHATRWTESVSVGPLRDHFRGRLDGVTKRVFG